MPNNLVIYMVAHQPRRVRLPAQLIPRGTSPEKREALIFDEQMDRRHFDKGSKCCYRPATPLSPPLTVERRRRLPLPYPAVERLATDGRHLRDLGPTGAGRVRLPRLGLRDLWRAPPG